MSANVYELHGLRVRSELPLDGQILEKCNRPDLEVRLVEASGDTADVRKGTVLAQVERIEYTLTATNPGEYVIRFGNQFEYLILSDRGLIEVRLYADADPQMASILLAGNVLSSVLALAGECVLHASGIQVDGSTLAIVGASGMGKSTVTALFCAAGARLISDDVLRLESSDGAINCFAGTSLIRLRPAAAELARLFPPDAATNTSDGRIAVQAERASGLRFRLDAILVPKPSRDAREVCVERLRGRDALVELLRYPRIVGWRAAEPTRRLFEVLAEAVTVVPVYSAEIPWGAPFDQNIPNQLLRELEPMARRVTAT